jgi:hypothetical protein
MFDFEEQISLYDENMKRNNGPLYDKKHFYYSNFQSCLRYGIMLWSGDKESNKIFLNAKIGPLNN